MYVLYIADNKLRKRTAMQMRNLSAVWEKAQRFLYQLAEKDLFTVTI